MMEKTECERCNKAILKDTEVNVCENCGCDICSECIAGEINGEPICKECIKE